MLYDVRRGEEIYQELDLTLSRMQNQHGCLPIVVKERTAAFLTECSRYRYIIGDMEPSHCHVMEALRTINDAIDGDPHPRIIIDTLRQVTYTYLQLGRRRCARLAIEKALTLCKHICEAAAESTMCSNCYVLSDSQLFLDCLVDYGFYLEKTDRLGESYKVISQAYRVSMTPTLASPSFPCLYVFFTLGDGRHIGLPKH